MSIQVANKDLRWTKAELTKGQRKTLVTREAIVRLGEPFKFLADEVSGGLVEPVQEEVEKIKTNLGFSQERTAEAIGFLMEAGSGGPHMAESIEAALEAAHHANRLLTGEAKSHNEALPHLLESIGKNLAELQGHLNLIKERTDSLVGHADAAADELYMIGAKDESGMISIAQTGLHDYRLSLNA